MDEVPPPSEHVLRPHHVGLLTILMLAFKDLEIKRLPPPFALHLHRILLNEISEVVQPKSHDEILHELNCAPRADVNECREFLQSIHNAHDVVATAENLANFFGNLTILFAEKVDDEPAVFMRRSIFGYFCRRCFLSFLKLSFSGVVKLQKDCQAWYNGNDKAGYEDIHKDELNHELLIYRTQADNNSWAKPHTYEVWERGQAVGDEKIAAENLQRFFEQRFHENNDSGYRQHALLNLARMHYIQDEYAAAQKLLMEAVSVARTSGDRKTLQHCMSLLHRLPPPSSATKPVLNQLQPDLHPLDLLYDVKKLAEEQNEQPLGLSFTKTIQALGLYDHWCELRLAVPLEEEQWAFHAVQSVLWNVAGCDELAGIEEDIVIAFADPENESINPITLILNKAWRQARLGKYELALAMLLEPTTWRSLTLREFIAWASEIWHILALRAVRQGQDRLYYEYLLPRRPTGPFSEKEYHFVTEGGYMGKIRNSLFEVLKMRKHGQASATIEHLLKALWHSEFLCRMNEYRTGIILLADVGLEFGLSKRCTQILNEIMPQIICGHDLEQRAVACFTLARCMILTADSDPETLNKALPYLFIAETDFTAIQALNQLKDVQYMVAVVYNTLGLENESDASARKHADTETRMKELEGFGVDKEIQDIMELVSTIGAGLAGR